MEEQLEQQREQLEKKRRFEEVSETIIKAVKMMKKVAEKGEFFPDPIDYMSTDVLSYVHDSRLETVEINLRPQKLELTSLYDKKIQTIRDLKNVKSIREAIKEQILEGIEEEILHSPICSIYYDCDPIPLRNPWLNFGDIIYNFKQIYLAYRLLGKYENDIVAFDNSVLEDLKQIIDSLLKVFVESLASEHTINISSADKSQQIFRKLLNEVIDLESMRELLKELSAEICDKRLIAIQREIFSKS